MTIGYICISTLIDGRKSFLLSTNFLPNMITWYWIISYNYGRHLYQFHYILLHPLPHMARTIFGQISLLLRCFMRYLSSKSKREHTYMLNKKKDILHPKLFWATKDIENVEILFLQNALLVFWLQVQDKWEITSRWMYLNTWGWSNVTGMSMRTSF